MKPKNRPNPERRQRERDTKAQIAAMSSGQTYIQRIGELLCHFVKRDHGKTLIEIMSYDEFRASRREAK
jgi:hypothetical protein